jgi:hypothetical protein
MAPHLGSWGLLAELMARPRKAFDSSDLALWFAPLRREEALAATKLLHDARDRANLLRLLWALPHLGASLSKPEHARLLELYDLSDSSVRAVIMRFAILSENSGFGPRLVDSVLAGSKPTESWEELWRTHLIGRFSVGISFEDAAAALTAPSASFLVADRGCRTEDLDIYTMCLNTEFRRILLAQTPEFIDLPEVTLISVGTTPDVAFPRFHKRPTHSVRIADSWMSRPSEDLGSELARMFSSDLEEMARKHNEDLRRKVQAIFIRLEDRSVLMVCSSIFNGHDRLLI